jgi:RNA polymerase sigma factor (sigma-70 family)
MDATDQALLREFATRRCERSFRRLVERHLRLVYSVAERVTGERGLAEEVAQTTFAKLAEKSPELDGDTVIAGWLYHTARNLALMTVRSEVRRRQREEIAATMNTDEPGPNVVAEHLEAAMDQLPPADRDALVLRFFEDRNLREVGHELGLTEDAARMRVNRALEKLRGVFDKLGITGSAAWLGTTLTASATASVPTGLGATITTSVLGGTAIAAATTALITETTATTMSLFNLKTAAAILGAAAVTGTTTYLVQEREVERVRADYQTLNETHGKLAAEQQEARELIQLRDEQVERLKRDVADLPRLRGEIDALRRQLSELAIQKEEAPGANQSVALPVSEPAPEKPIVKPFNHEDWGEHTSRKVMYPLTRMGLSMILHAQENGGWFPSPSQVSSMLRADSASPSSTINPSLGKALDPDDVVLVFQGNLDDIPTSERARTIVARRSYFMGPDEKFAGAFLFADGSVQLTMKDTLEELILWETEHVFPLERQSRR